MKLVSIMKQEVIPGHVRAYTWVLALVAIITAVAVTRNWHAPVGMLILIIGEFLGNQATHLAQHHDELPPTWIEVQQQRHKVIFQILGLCIVIVGIYIGLK
ncbi:MAG TPA: hypothetical protein VK675_03305 [Candidatus Paceibacterota bacterium]|nr:hypothetical protein [Candidatus Paceibacterota bacterium]